MANFNHIKNTIMHFLPLFMILSTVSGKGTAPHDIECKDAPNGLHEIGCWGYANCVDGKPDIHDCDVNLVFDRVTMTCVKPGTTTTDCFLSVDCNGKVDGSYPDYADACVTYYRCFGEKNLGRFYCPAQTAFNENLQICDYPYNLLPPCGTKKAPATQAPKPTTTPTTTTQNMMTTTKPTTVMTTQTMMTTTMPPSTAVPVVTTTPQMMTSEPTTQKLMQTSQLHMILTSGSPKPSAQASTTTTQMPPMSSTT